MSEETQVQEKPSDGIGSVVTVPIDFNLETALPRNEIVLNYYVVKIDEDRKSVRIADTHDEKLKESLSKMGLVVTNEDILIPLKKQRKNKFCPSYFPFSRVANMNGKGVFMLTLNPKEYTILVITGDPLMCIDKSLS